MDELVTRTELYEMQCVESKTSGDNYIVKSPMTGAKTMLVREQDFGVIPYTNKPSLYKSGAEKIANLYGVQTHYHIETKEECFDLDKPFFFYNVRCDLCKISNEGKEYVFYTAFGSANTRERRNGKNGAFDAANATLKMAQKRAFVSAVVAMGGLSDLFTMDMEDEKFMEGYKEIAKTVDPESFITNPQIKRLWAIAQKNGYNAKEAKKLLAEHGVTDTKQIKQKDYEAVCNLFIPAEGKND